MGVCPRLEFDDIMLIYYLGDYFYILVHIFRLRFAGGTLMARLKMVHVYLDPPSPRQTKNKRRKKVVNVGPPLTKLSGPVHVFLRLLH